MSCSIDISVIIPHRDSVALLPRLFDSIPVLAGVEIILVDNSLTPVTKEGIGINRDYVLLYSAPERGAGGARNEGIKVARGKWVLFADADDFFAPGAFDAFYENIDNEEDVIFFGASGIYSDTGERSSRGDNYSLLIRDYLAGLKTETDLRLVFTVPWAKMVKKSLLDEFDICFDEVPASNDVFFSMMTGYYAKKIKAESTIVYIVTVSRGSLTKRRDYDALQSRYQVYLRYNQFVKEHGLAKYQKSIMFLYMKLARFGFKALVNNTKQLVQYHQNPFVGLSRWMGTFLRTKKNDRQDKEYYTA